LKAIRLSASSAGLQPYTIFVISNEAYSNLYFRTSSHTSIIEQD
jgi:uncharacterized surface protein with fasciclin (FAS1) repeats